MKILKTKQPTKKKSGPPVLYPFDKMKKGNSFKLKTKSLIDVKKKRISVLQAALNRGYKVSTRIEGRTITVFMVGKNTAK